MKLLTEHAPHVEMLVENTAKGKNLYIEGVFLMSNTKNRNGRVYPKNVMEEAVENYQNQYIKERRAIGELNHPADRPFADPAKAAIFIESLSWQGDNVIGKAKILNNPDGDRIKSLLEAGFKFGVSSRGLGDVIKESNGTDLVRKFMLNAIDAVDMPSGQLCYVNSVNESMEWIQENGIWIPGVHDVLEAKKPTADELLEGFRQLLSRRSK